MNRIRLILVYIFIGVVISSSGLGPIAVNSTETQIPYQESINLYRVLIKSHPDTEILAKGNVDPVLRVSGGYLVLGTAMSVKNLYDLGLTCDLIATDINRSRLALDFLRKRSRPPLGQLIYDEAGLSLYRIEPDKIKGTDAGYGLTPLMTDRIPILYGEPKQQSPISLKNLIDLNSLADLISVDSCQSYVERLESFQTRVLGTDSNYASRDWLITKFHEFGYDSVITDTFPVLSFEGYTGIAHNVIAYKEGTTYPRHQIVIGAHRDSYSSDFEFAPGADDDASGTAGVLEIARVLADVETPLSFVFIPIDAEELGLFGAYNYAGRAANRGDSIVLMINMDMIGYSAGTDTISVVYAPDDYYANIWMDICDTLQGVNIHPVPSLGAFADESAFYTYGYEVVGIYEYFITPHYHTPHDSSVYLEFDYMSHIVKITLATAATVAVQYTPDPMLTIDYPDGVPDMLFPGHTTSIEVVIESYAGGTPVPGSELLHYALNGGLYQEVALVPTGGMTYQATLPALSCYDQVKFYVSADETGGTTFNHPIPKNAFKAGVAIEILTLFEDSFESDLGWTVEGNATDGNWERAEPLGYGFHGRVPVDYDGSGWCFLTEQESAPWFMIGHDVDNGNTRMVSPVIDMTGGEPLLQYARWFSNHDGDFPYSDHFEVYVSNNNGMTWRMLEMVGGFSETSGGWYEKSFWISDCITPTDQMLIAFEASDDEEDSNIEAGIDAVKVTLYSCGPAPEITTGTLPDAYWGESYTTQLECSGGYGSIVWADEYNDLAGTGLSITSEGLISGIPQLTGTTEFTALATDVFDRSDEKLLAVNIEYPFVCGDANADSTVNVGDAVFLIAFVFNSGPAPDPVASGDANWDGDANVGDAVFIINYVFKGGPAPECQ
jgi:hypothetical protein